MIMVLNRLFQYVLNKLVAQSVKALALSRVVPKVTALYPKS